MHPTDEDIARLIDNKVTHAEREEILGHIDDCEECAAVFRNVLKFRELEEEHEQRRFLVKMFQGKNVWLPIAAGILLFALLTVFFLYQSHTKISGFSWANAPGIEALRHIEENVSKFEEDSSYGFSPNLSIKTVSVRLGFYIEDLNRLVLAKEIQVKEKILRLLEKVMSHWFRHQIRIPEPDRSKINQQFVVAVASQLETRLKQDALDELYFFGKTIERWIFLCLEGRLPDKGPIKKLIRVSKTSNLARIIPEILKNIQDEKNLEQILKHLQAVREIFL